ncbi:MAG: tyrosine protein kinase [Tannerella sp.]|jgi:uncharacterized protein involved in exopolysaccharide biosynthesis|nr:tyrosine protein kinase [Tannerella sp.]
MENKDKETVGLKSIIVRYLHQWKLFLAVFLFSFIPAILYLIIYPRTYEFAAGVQLQAEKESSMASMGLGEAAGLMKSFGIGTGGGGIDIDDEIAILTSNRMFRYMIYDLGLYVSYSKPYSLYKMYNEAPLKLTVDSVTMANLDDQYNFTVSVSPENVKVKVKSLLGRYKETITCEHLPVTIKLGADEFRLDYDHDGASEKNFKLKITCTPLSWLAEKLGEDVLVEDVSTSSNILELTCSDHSGERGKDMLNTLIQKYNEDAEAFESIRDRKTMKLVDERIAKIIADLNQVELDIQAYKTKNEMTLLESDVLLYSETVKGIRTAIMEVESQNYLINMLDEYVKDPANKYSVIPSLMTIAEGEQSGAISVYNKAIVERDRLLKNSNETNPMFKIMDNQVETLRKGVSIMIENARKTSEKTLERLKGEEDEVLSKMKTIPAKEREYVNYRRNQEILQGLYLMLLQKREETNLSLENRMARARLIEPAYMKKKPLGPRKLYAAIGILILTLVIPVGYLLVKDLFISLKEEYKRTE